MDYKFLFQIIICFLLSFLIGIERQYRRKIIGLRTSILVAIGSFLFVTFSINVGSSDISRIASQVVTGMGFLGAGVIIKESKKVRGLTTAATIWCTSAIGVLTAGGAIIEAITGTIIILITNILLKKINSFINNMRRNHDLLIEYKLSIKTSNKNFNKIKTLIEDFFKQYNTIVVEKSYDSDLFDGVLNYKFQIKSDYSLNMEILEMDILKDKVKNYQLQKLGEIKLDEFED